MKRSIVVRVVAGVIANTVLGAFIAPARAADVPMPAPYAPVARPLYSWTGCYGGVNIGGGSANKTFTDVNGTLGPAGGTLGSHTARGVVGGGQGGCDYQAGMFVFGIAALLGLATAIYAAGHFAIDTDVYKLISKELPSSMLRRRNWQPKRRRS